MHVPVCSYRLQFNPAFKFVHAKNLASYLEVLGISDVYASPIFKSRKDSAHGYDVVDHSAINSELGTDDEFKDLIAALRTKNIFWIQDIVPNHMAFNGENRALIDVLENGKFSPFYKFFDIDWNHHYESIRGRVLAPFLGKFYAEALESQEIKLTFDEQGLGVCYYSLRLPLQVETYKEVFLFNATQDELSSYLNAAVKIFKEIEDFEREDSEGFYKLLQDKKNELCWLYKQNEEIRQRLNKNIEIFNATAGDARSFDSLDGLLKKQLFRLCFWKVATEEINYRRFFNINELICLRVEDVDVFEYTHSLIAQLVRSGKISGIRKDHIDGLYDPTQYLKRLRAMLPDSYMVVEKILMDKEKLLTLWPIQGTTGYDFLNYVNGLFCQRKNQRKFSRVYAKFSGFKITFEELVYQKKRLIVGKHMAGNIDNLALFIKKLSSESRHGTDITLYGLKRALVEILAHFPVYRTYVSEFSLRGADKTYIDHAIKKAKLIRPGLLHELNFIEDFLLMGARHLSPGEEKNSLLEFSKKFQQVSGPLMAKGVEDTIFYVYNRLLSLNEVGSDPGKFGTYANDFHNFNKRRNKLWPHSLNALSTHDVKRGEDARARINVLSEQPKVWEQKIKYWHKLNKKQSVAVFKRGWK